MPLASVSCQRQLGQPVLGHLDRPASLLHALAELGHLARPSCPCSGPRRSRRCLPRLVERRNELAFSALSTGSLRLAAGALRGAASFRGLHLAVRCGRRFGSRPSPRVARRNGADPRGSDRRYIPARSVSRLMQALRRLRPVARHRQSRTGIGREPNGRRPVRARGPKSHSVSARTLSSAAPRPPTLAASILTPTPWSSSPRSCFTIRALGARRLGLHHRIHERADVLDQLLSEKLALPTPA